MEVRNRQGHMPIPVTVGDLKDQKWCPCCKNGTIIRDDEAPMVACTVCGQRYQIKNEEERDEKDKTEAKSA